MIVCPAIVLLPFLLCWYFCLICLRLKIWNHVFLLYCLHYLLSIAYLTYLKIWKLCLCFCLNICECLIRIAYLTLFTVIFQIWNSECLTRIIILNCFLWVSSLLCLSIVFWIGGRWLQLSRILAWQLHCSHGGSHVIVCLKFFLLSLSLSFPLLLSVGMFFELCAFCWSSLLLLKPL